MGMKRYFAILILACVTLCAAATPPNLACEAIFDRPELRTEGHKLVKITDKENYFRKAEANADPQLRDEIIKLVREDMKRAYSVMESFNNGKGRIILNVENNGKGISIGLQYDDKGYVDLFVQGPPKAFK